MITWKEHGFRVERDNTDFFFLFPYHTVAIDSGQIFHYFINI